MRLCHDISIKIRSNVKLVVDTRSKTASLKASKPITAHTEILYSYSNEYIYPTAYSTKYNITTIIPVFQMRSLSSVSADPNPAAELSALIGELTVPLYRNHPSKECLDSSMLSGCP